MCLYVVPDVTPLVQMVGDKNVYPCDLIGLKFCH